mmetsp:Transcript_36439/g.53615  ORF Transcript_36439/g.53615 Transcript_36439/m.53615 type:complete len:279 (+) Transcript_36439:2109-2945(+)
MASISSSIFLLTAADKPILIRNGPRFFGTGGSSFGGLLAASSPSSISPSSSSSSSSSLPLLLSGSFASSSSSSNKVASPLASSPLFTSTCDGISTDTFSAFVLTATAGSATAAAASAAEEGPANETLEHVDPLLELALSSFSFSGAIFLDGDETVAAVVVVAPRVSDSSIFFFFSSLPCNGGTDSASFSGKEDDIMGTSASLVTIGFNCPCAMKFPGTVVLLLSSTAAGGGANVDVAGVGAVVSSRISPSSSELASSFSSFLAAVATSVLASGALPCC